MIQFVTYKAYLGILSSDTPFTGYDVTVKLKDIIFDLLNYLLATYNEHGVWDSNAVYTIARCTRPDTTRAESNLWASIVRRALCEELGLPDKGYRLHYNVTGEFIRFIPRRVKSA